MEWLVKWYNSRPSLDLAEALAQAGGADRVAVMAVDVTVGFCSQGPLSSVRVGGIVEPIARLFGRAHELGIRHFVLPQDTHSEDAVEFGSYPAHCVRGSDEAETVPELRNLPFAESYVTIEKDSISSGIGTELDDWLARHPEVTTFVVVGDCTDLCVYQLAMHLRLRSHAHGWPEVRVVVPIEGVDTFDTPVDVAARIGAMPHHGDLMHLVFLYSMAQNGIDVVERIV
jgi:nicotinamidase-related amidase